MAEYAADWINDGRLPHGGTYGVRGPDGEVVASTNALKAGWDRAREIAAALNAREAAEDDA